VTEQELNKKLLEFAGFEYHPHKLGDFLRDYEPAYWIYPDGRKHMECPYFPHNETACFKWLVPKLNQLGWGVNLMQAMNNSYWKCVLWEWGNPFTTPLDHKREDAETPALALCRASVEVYKLVLRNL